jgi:hypothetical protein
MNFFLPLQSIQWVKSHLLLISCLVAYFVPAQNAGTQKTVLERKVQWVSGKYKFTDVLTFNYSDYDYYKNLPKRFANRKYASETESHSYLLKLAKELDVDARELGLSRDEVAQYLIDFVQQAVPYKSDPSNDGLDYPKYPIETIVENGGDCEDKAALLVALLNTFDFDAVFVQFDDHMGVGLQGENGTGSYYVYNGKKYYYVESTAPNWEIGAVPPEYGKAMIISAPLVKLYTRATTKPAPVASSSGETKVKTPTSANVPAPKAKPAAASGTTMQTRRTIIIIVAPE